MSDIAWTTPLGAGSRLHRGCCIDWDGRIWTTGTKGGGVTGTWLAYSDDKGASWTSVIAPWYSWSASVACQNMIVDHVNRIIYAIVGLSPSSKRLYYSIDGGANWSYNAGPVTSPDVQYFSSNGEWVISNDGALVGIEYYGGIFRTTDYGATWALAYPVPSGLGGFSYSSISKDPNNSHIHATYRSGTYTYQFLKSTDNGQTWVGYTPNSFAYWMYATSQVITASGAQIIGTGYGDHGITRSPDFGLTIANPFISTYRLHRGTIDDTGRIWFVGNASPDVNRLALVYSDDDGLTWQTELAPTSVTAALESRVISGPGAVIALADGQSYAGVLEVIVLVTEDPEITPSTGYSAGPVTASVTCATSGASLHYTTDGSVPTAESPVLSAGGIVLGSWISGAVTLRVMASAPYHIPSGVATATYQFTAQAPMVSLQMKPESGYFFSEAESRKPRTFGACGKGIFAGTIQWELLDSEWPMFLDWWEDKHKGVDPFNIYCCTGAEPLLHTFQAVGPYEVVRDTGVRKVTLPVKITMRPTGLYSGWGSFLGGPPVAYPVFVPMPQWGFQREEAAVFLSTTGAPTAARPVATRGELLSLEWKALTGMQFDVLVDWWSTYLGQGRRKFTISLPGETGPLLCQLVEDPAFTVEGVHFRGSMKVFAAPVRTLAPPPA